MRVHAIVNLYRPDAVQAAKTALDSLRAKSVEVGADGESASSVGVDPVPADKLAECDLMVSFGGDGTLIRAAHVCSERGTPILGVYFGRFGFVTQCDPREVGAALSQFLDGQSEIEERMMVQTDLIRDNKTVVKLHSLNEAVVQRSATTRLLTFDVDINGLTVAKFPADGVMVATPTGSTAYNLSAGGPIVDPAMDGLLVTAIMPHSLTARPLVVRPDATIGIRIETRGDAVLSCDGQSRLHLLSGDAVRVTRSSRVTRLITVDPCDFYGKVAERFKWSKRPGND